MAGPKYSEQQKEMFSDLIDRRSTFVNSTLCGERRRSSCAQLTGAGDVGSVGNAGTPTFGAACRVLCPLAKFVDTRVVLTMFVCDS